MVLTGKKNKCGVCAVPMLKALPLGVLNCMLGCSDSVDKLPCWSDNEWFGVQKGTIAKDRQVVLGSIIFL